MEEEFTEVLDLADQAARGALASEDRGRGWGRRGGEEDEDRDDLKDGGEGEVPRGRGFWPRGSWEWGGGAQQYSSDRSSEERGRGWRGRFNHDSSNEGDKGEERERVNCLTGCFLVQDYLGLFN